MRAFFASPLLAAAAAATTDFSTWLDLLCRSRSGSLGRRFRLCDPLRAIFLNQGLFTALYELFTGALYLV